MCDALRCANRVGRLGGASGAREGRGRARGRARGRPACHPQLGVRPEPRASIRSHRVCAVHLARSLARARARALRHRRPRRCVFAIGAEPSVASESAGTCVPPLRPKALCACAWMGEPRVEPRAAHSRRGPLTPCAHTCGHRGGAAQAHGRPRSRDAVPAVDAARRGHLHRHGQGGRGRQARRRPARLYGEHSEAAARRWACHVAVRLRFAATRVPRGRWMGHFAQADVDRVRRRRSTAADRA